MMLRFGVLPISLLIEQQGFFAVAANYANKSFRRQEKCFAGIYVAERGGEIGLLLLLCARRRGAKWVIGGEGIEVKVARD